MGVSATMQRSAKLFGVTAITASMLVFAVPAAQAQWRLQESHTTADLSGIFAIDDNVAWASGSNGTVLRTEDGGRSWHSCAVPPGGANLDLSSIQAFDDRTALVLATGKGDLSHLYKTVDGCMTWKKVLDNPDAVGAFKSLRRISAFDLALLGDPVDGKFALFVSHNAGDSWSRSDDPGLAVPADAKLSVGGGAALTNVISQIAFGTVGQGASVYTYSPICRGNNCTLGWSAKAVPIANAAPMAGVFSLSGRNVMVQSTAIVTGIGTMPATTLVAVGGDPEKPDQGPGSAAFSTDGGVTWRAAATPPDGYRSAIDFDGAHDRFVAVGPSGTDETVDDGLIWQALKPKAGDASGADKSWTSLSLPFVVGPHGRIGRLSDISLTRN